MGIKNLLKLLETHDDIVTSKRIDDFRGKKIAIDISIMLYKIIIGIRRDGADLTNNRGEVTSHILGLFNKTIQLLQKNILPVYVFDGKPPSIKNKTIEYRKNTKIKAFEKYNNAETKEDKIKYFKRTVRLSKEQLDQCRELLNLMGIPFIDAPEEADSQCAYLAKYGFVDSVFTDDMDILTFGSPSIIKNLTSFNKNIIEINLNKIKEVFKINQKQFIELCILLGCDYCDTIIDIPNKTIFADYLKIKDIDQYLEENDKSIDYEETVEYFRNPTVNKDIRELRFRRPDISTLSKKLVNDYGLIKFTIDKKLDKLNYYYSKNSRSTCSYLN